MKFAKVVFTDRPIDKLQHFKQYTYNNSIDVKEKDMVVVETVYGYAVAQVAGFTNDKPKIDVKIKNLIIKIPVGDKNV